MKALEYLNANLLENVRISSLRHIHEYILNNDVKRVIEFGTSRVNFEGNSTIFLALLAKEKKAKFTSIDINQNNIDNAKSIMESFDADLLDYVEFICKDQYVYMNEYDQIPSQYVYLDCDDNQKHKSLDALLKSNILDNKALICIDDMITQDYGCQIQVEGVVDIVNQNSKFLTPLTRNDSHLSLNHEQIKWNSLNETFPQSKNNCLVYEKGIRQFEYQILLEYKK